ncbi:hypothetical protein Lnau_2472 [Legionella nautarum]|uniref:Uncharacterized protein n=1 Tax=Legionella nautarum TaxID=45070 RepID=A0A0W0WKI2_9GAMM|nr:hypothetical protein [Legionella nautarum]KTD32824.1 hypothetical protein Lnau_2472 [Legionella nautarum]
MNNKDTISADRLIPAQRSNKDELSLTNLTQNEQQLMPRDEGDSSASSEDNKLYYGMFSALY